MEQATKQASNQKIMKQNHKPQGTTQEQVTEHTHTKQRNSKLDEFSITHWTQQTKGSAQMNQPVDNITEQSNGPSSSQTKVDNTTNNEWVYQGDGAWGQSEQPHLMQPTAVFQGPTIMQELQLQMENEDLMLANLVNKLGYPNRYGARIPVKTKWNLEAFEEKLQGYEDQEVVEWLRYGWPSGRLPTLDPPGKTFKNHKGATDHPLALQKYITKEISKGAVIGPFTHIPFRHKVGISPISTRPKKNSTERRIIVDLSFPPGVAVNDGMIKDNYLGMTVKLTFPRVDDLALRIYTLGKSAMMFKIDLSRYFRQLPLDPGDYSLIGYVINDELYFDKVLPMGMRTAPYVAQRVTNAIRHIHEQLEYYLLNYVDDFLGAEEKARIWAAFHHLTTLLEQLGVETAPDKIVPPTTRIEFLGITLDSQTMTMEVPEDKLKEIKAELQTWLYRTEATRRDVESLIGKLQFLAKCVKAGRIFIARLINWMKQLPRQGRHTIPRGARKDIAWWGRFAHTYNGISMIWMHNNPQLDRLIATDASKTGFGGITGTEYFRGKFPKQWKDRNIAELEIRAVIIALKIWAKKVAGQYFWIHVDNEAVAIILNSGASRDETLQDALREVAMIAAENQFIIKAKHISGVSNRIPDWLSRWSELEARRKFNQYAREKSLKRCKLPSQYLQFTNQW